MKSSNHIAFLAHLSILTETLTLMGASNVEVKFYRTNGHSQGMEEASLMDILVGRGSRHLDYVRIQVRMSHSGERLGVSQEVALDSLLAPGVCRCVLPRVVREFEQAFLEAIRAKAESTATVKATSLI